jgi:cytoskeletal protein RodZ
MPPVTGAEEAPPRWTARAGVPVRGPRQAAPQEQPWVPDQEPRTWWAPILIVLAILVLLGLIALGLWLAMRGQPTPAPSASASPTSSASPSPSPTPSQTTPSASPPAILVAVPPVRGLSVSDAQTILQSQGLNSKVVTQVSDLPPGTVIDTNPAASTQVPAGTEVTLFVATPPPSPSSPAQS